MTPRAREGEVSKRVVERHSSSGLELTLTRSVRSSGPKAGEDVLTGPRRGMITERVAVSRQSRRDEREVESNTA